MSEKETRVAVVTGGSSGIGRACCLRLSRMGFRVWFNHFDPDGNEAAGTEKQVEELGGLARGLKVDVRSEEDVRGFFRRVVDEEGRVDVLVNNAGITRDGLLVRMKEQDWDQVVGVNLKGAFLCIREVSRPMMRQRSGRIVNMASVVAASGNAGQANYSASKAGLVGLTLSAARELAPRNITVNAVAPGFIETRMTDELPGEVREAILERTPLKRMGTPGEVAHLVGFLCSEEAGFITGQVLHVNGGLYM